MHSGLAGWARARSTADLAEDSEEDRALDRVLDLGALPVQADRAGVEEVAAAVGAEDAVGGAVAGVIRTAEVLITASSPVSATEGASSLPIPGRFLSRCKTRR